jgi:signal transduction histidine kinase
MTEDRPKVLVVDDYPANLTAMGHVLKRLDCETVFALSGTEALRLTLEHDFALALLDVQMPEMDGYELAELIRGSQRTRDLPIIFVTACYKDDVHRLRGYGAGAVDYIEKPVDEFILCTKVGIFIDLHRQRVRLEGLVRDLSRSNRELEQFAYAASHDLREPLRMVYSYIQLLEHGYGALLDDEGRSYIGYVKEGTQRLERLVRDLLEFSRVGQDARPHVAVALNAVVDEAMRSLTLAVADAKAHVTVDPDLPTVSGDADELRRLFQNLIDNALKYREPGRSPEVHVTARRDGAMWRLSVSDNGIGIAPEHFDRIFQIFRRLHSRDKYEGTGIGLALCRRIAERHNGEIQVDSEPGVGSTFHVLLPAMANTPR